MKSEYNIVHENISDKLHTEQGSITVQSACYKSNFVKFGAETIRFIVYLAIFIAKKMTRLKLCLALFMWCTVYAMHCELCI